MGAVPLSVPAARSGGPPTDTGSALRAASAAESGTGLCQRAASAVEAGRAADLTVWASSLRPRTPSGSSSASTWRSRECWTCSPRVGLRLASCRRGGRRALFGGVAGGCGSFHGVPLPRSSCRPARRCRGRPSGCLAALRWLPASPRRSLFLLSPAKRPAEELAWKTWCGVAWKWSPRCAAGRSTAGEGSGPLQGRPGGCRALPPRTSLTVWGPVLEERAERQGGSLPRAGGDGGVSSSAKVLLSMSAIGWLLSSLSMSAFREVLQRKSVLAVK